VVADAHMVGDLWPACAPTCTYLANTFPRVSLTIVWALQRGFVGAAGAARACGCQRRASLRACPQEPLLYTLRPAYHNKPRPCSVDPSALTTQASSRPSLEALALAQVEQLYQVTSLEDQAAALWAGVQKHIRDNPSGYKARMPGFLLL